MAEEITAQSFDSPDERITFANGRSERVRLGDVTFWLSTVSPDWQFSRDNAPDLGTERCPERHHLYVVSGRLTIEMDDGTRTTLEQGDVAFVPPGHDAWVEGDEHAAFLEVDGLEA